MFTGYYESSHGYTHTTTEDGEYLGPRGNALVGVMDNELREEKFYAFKFPHREHKYSKSERSVRHYLTERKACKLFHFLMEHLVSNRPEDPMRYLAELMDRCMLFRSGIVTHPPPTVFTADHIASMFTAFDPAGTGRITMKQYFKGMETLGIESVPAQPRVDEDNMVLRETFEFIAEKALVDMLRQFVDVGDVPAADESLVDEEDLIPCTPQDSYEYPGSGEGWGSPYDEGLYEGEYPEGEADLESCLEEESEKSALPSVQKPLRRLRPCLEALPIRRLFVVPKKC